MRKLFYILILLTALVTVALQYAVIQKQNKEFEELELLFEKIEQEFIDLQLLGEGV